MGSLGVRIWGSELRAFGSLGVTTRPCSVLVGLAAGKEGLSPGLIPTPNTQPQAIKNKPLNPKPQAQNCVGCGLNMFGVWGLGFIAHSCNNYLGL